MSPKEKAKEIVDAFINKTWDNTGHHMSTIVSKECAIIAVDEIIQDYKSYRVKHYLTLESSLYLCEYWLEVKKEIEAL